MIFETRFRKSCANPSRAFFVAFPGQAGRAAPPPLFARAPRPFSAPVSQSEILLLHKAEIYDIIEEEA
jgi:hypothetical protein